MRIVRALWPFQRPLGDAFRIGTLSDRRNKAQLESCRAIDQERTDAALERQWREAIRRNEIARLERRLLERVEAEMMEQPRYRRVQAI